MARRAIRLAHLKWLWWRVHLPEQSSGTCGQLTSNWAPDPPVRSAHNSPFCRKGFGSSSGIHATAGILHLSSGLVGEQLIDEFLIMNR